MNWKRPRNRTWKTLLLLVLTVGSGSQMLGHTTPDMVEARLAVHKWANALLNRDLETMALLLAPDMTTAKGETRDEYLERLRLGMHKVTHIWLRFAYFDQVAKNIVVRPIYIYRSRGVTKPGLTLTLRKTGEHWLIHHIESERRPELPAGASAGCGYRTPSGRQSPGRGQQRRLLAAPGSSEEDCYGLERGCGR